MTKLSAQLSQPTQPTLHYFFFITSILTYLYMPLKILEESTKDSLQTENATQTLSFQFLLLRWLLFITSLTSINCNRSTGTYLETFNHNKYKPCHVIFRKHDLLIRYKHKQFSMYTSPLTATLTSHFAFTCSIGCPPTSPQTETFQYSQHLHQNKILVVRNTTLPNSQTPQSADFTQHLFSKILSSTNSHHHVNSKEVKPCNYIGLIREELKEEMKLEKAVTTIWHMETIYRTKLQDYTRRGAVLRKERRLCLRKAGQGIDMSEEESETEYESQLLLSVQTDPRDLHIELASQLAGELQVGLEVDGAPQDF